MAKELKFTVLYPGRKQQTVLLSTTPNIKKEKNLYVSLLLGNNYSANWKMFRLLGYYNLVESRAAQSPVHAGWATKLAACMLYRSADDNGWRPSLPV